MNVTRTEQVENENPKHEFNGPFFIKNKISSTKNKVEEKTNGKKSNFSPDNEEKWVGDQRETR